MIDPGLLKLAAVVAVPLAASTAAGEVFADEHVRFLSEVAGFVVAVIAAFTWLDHRFDKKIDKKNKAQTLFIIREFRHLREVLAVRFGVPELAVPEVTGELDLELEEKNGS